MMSQVGVEGVTGATLTLSLAAVEAFPALISALTRAVRIAGQPAPLLGGAGAGGPLIAAPAP
jgi:hypothetical protein